MVPAKGAYASTAESLNALRKGEGGGGGSCVSDTEEVCCEPGRTSGGITEPGCVGWRRSRGAGPGVGGGVLKPCRGACRPAGPLIIPSLHCFSVSKGLDAHTALGGPDATLEGPSSRLRADRRWTQKVLNMCIYFIQAP
ncbi:hypothetical protein VZT92_007925 [Zoarces viviparus]|uniref:Uncharacterized protein n=1 Tax=Zoarces viviparus TaxID=48416 RepID=A0AAW1FL49_ZOAVI